MSFYDSKRKILLRAALSDTDMLSTAKSKLGKSKTVDDLCLDVISGVVDPRRIGEVIDTALKISAIMGVVTLNAAIDEADSSGSSRVPMSSAQLEKESDRLIEFLKKQGVL